MADSFTALRKLGQSAFARRIGSEPGGASRVPVPGPLPLSDYEQLEVDAGKIWMSRHDEVMRPFMKRAGTWEPDEGRLLCSLVKPGERFLDIGANVGYFSVLVGKAAPGVSVDAVEPDPGNVRALEFNLWVNQVQASVWPLALDDSDRSLVLSGNATNFGDLRVGRVEDSVSNGSSGPKAPAPGDADDYQWVVPSASGDEIFAGRSFDVIKIDVQGWEFEVLSGMAKVLDRSPGVRVVAEFQPGIIRSQHRVPQDVLALYRHNGYRIRCQVQGNLLERSDDQIVELCDTAGSIGSVNLLLER